MVAFFWNSCFFHFLNGGFLLKQVEEVPEEILKLSSGRSRSFYRKPPFKKWKKQGFQKKATIEKRKEEEGQ
jgi:hypothetical protein